ncbi:MAG: hypothetical protein K0A93_08940 [Desulfuromonadaceae bacterium]|nr:hypothetical protein [Desulfuromonadaceae bacterium]
MLLLFLRVLRALRGERTPFRGGWLSANRQFLSQLPIPAPNPDSPIPALATQMLTLHQRLAAAKTEQDKTMLQREIAATDKQIDKLVYELYGLTAEEIALVEGGGVMTSKKIANVPPTPTTGEFLLYTTADGRIRIETRMQNETVWLNQKQLAELFQTSVPNINMHIKNIYAEGELRPEATIQDFLTVRQEGQREVQRHVACYNLETKGT